MRQAVEETGESAAKPDRHPPMGMGKTLLAPDYVVVAAVPEYDCFIHDPGMARLPNGVLVVASPCWQRRASVTARAREGWEGRRDAGMPELVAQELAARRHFTLMARSRDGGATWEQLDRLPYTDATPFYANGRLYMFVQHHHWSDVWFTASEDEGTTWSDPVRIFEGRYWNCSTPMAVHNGRLYWALNAGDWLGMAVISADLSGDLLEKSSWRISNVIRHPGTPASLTRNIFAEKKGLNKYWGADNWLEPNILVVNGRLRVAARVIIDEQSSGNLACICDVDDDGAAIDLRFAQFCGWPGGHHKFFILDDTGRSGLFWMLCNLATDSQDAFGRLAEGRAHGYRGGPGNERRTLALFYSVDALNWLPAGIAARWGGMLQSFMYPSAAIDGDDIIFISRTAQFSRNQHDADRTTFHRIRNFRDLALDIVPTADSFRRVMPPPFKPVASPSDAVVGRWMWHDGRTFRLQAGGKVAGAEGSWELAGEGRYRIVLDEEGGSLKLLGDGTLLAGETDDGGEIWAVRQP